jgi:hypothetical protein
LKLKPYRIGIGPVVGKPLGVAIPPYYFIEYGCRPGCRKYATRAVGRLYVDERIAVPSFISRVKAEPASPRKVL